MRSMVIYRLRDDAPVQFAAEELARYLERMDGEVRAEVRRALRHAPDTGGITLGLYEDFGLAASDVTSPEFDDRLHVAVTGLNGVIAGSNPRSVLLGVYRFLQEMPAAAGCARAATASTFPQVDLAKLDITLDDAPSYRHRGICIEGAVSYENVAEMIDWAPKVGLNGYFFQFMVPFTFFNRWYRHVDNPYLPPEPLTAANVTSFKAALQREMAQRGLAYHAVGHGWTCEPFGDRRAGLGREDLRGQRWSSRLPGRGERQARGVGRHPAQHEPLLFER